MRKLFVFITILFFASISCNNNDLKRELLGSENEELMTPEQIREKVIQTLQETGEFKWDGASDILLWSAIYHGGNKAALGYGNAAVRSSNNKVLDNAKNELIDILNEEENLFSEKSKEKIIRDEDSFFTHIFVQINSIETLKKIRQSKSLRFIEPSDFEITLDDCFEKSSDGSGCKIDNDNIESGDKKYSSTYGYYSWTMEKNKITTAWSQSSGNGVTIGIVDTGLESNNSLMNSSFNATNSSRTFEKKVVTGITDPDFDQWTTDDKCGHGTFISQAIGAPKTNSWNTIGVAYNCNLVMYRAVDNVLLNKEEERRRVAKAFTSLGDRSDVKIISMSMGRLDYSQILADGVIYAYNKGKLIFCAGGTSKTITNWNFVIFPARMSEVQAITGVTDESELDKCSTCHAGDEIDFVVVMEHEDSWVNNRRVVVPGYSSSNTFHYFGGSSVATATAAGMAALIWSKFPNATRDQIITSLQRASDEYPTPHDKFGYGRIDGSKIYNYLTPPPPPTYTVSITGPLKGYSGIVYTWTAHVTNGSSPYTYQWEYKYTGVNWTEAGTSASFSMELPEDEALQLRLTVSCPKGTKTAYRTVINLGAGGPL